MIKHNNNQHINSVERSHSDTRRARWAAVGAAVAVSVGAGGIGLATASESTPARWPLDFTPTQPCRLVDTRPGPEQVGPRAESLGADETYTVESSEFERCDLPKGVGALTLNVTAIGATKPTFLTIFPDPDDRPVASHLNPVPGAPPTPNAVVAAMGRGRTFSIYNYQGQVDVVVDVVGFYSDAITWPLFDDRLAAIESRLNERIDAVVEDVPATRERWAHVDFIHIENIEIDEDGLRVERFLQGIYCVSPSDDVFLVAPIHAVLAEASNKIVSIGIGSGNVCGGGYATVRIQTPAGAYVDGDFVVSHRGEVIAEA